MKKLTKGNNSKNPKASYGVALKEIALYIFY